MNSWQPLPDLNQYWNPKSRKYGEPPPRQKLPEPLDYGPDKLWHYGSVFTVPRYLRCRKIGVYAEDEMPRIASVSWFSANPVFESSSAPGWHVGCDRRTMMPEFKRIGQVTNAERIEISPAAAPYRWDEYWGWSGVNELWIGQFASSVMGCCDTNPSDWFVSPFAVPASAWRVIELWDDQQLRWVPIQASADRMVQEMVPLAEEVLNG